MTELDIFDLPRREPAPSGRDSIQTLLAQHHARDSLKRFRAKNNVLASVIVTVDLLVYVLAFVLGGLLQSIWVKIACGIICGLWTARLFVIAHDACHQSLTSNHRVNRIVGRAAFLPSLTPYSTWELAHNSVHHVFSNWRERDYVWSPFDRAQYEAFSLPRRGLEHIYRNPSGHGLYYLVEIWWKRLLFPTGRYLASRTASYVLDSMLVTLFLCLQLIFLVKVSDGSGRNAVIDIVLLELVPFIIWNALMGFTILLHHTHPRVPWFSTHDEWLEHETQLHNTVHTLFEVPLDRFFHNIYQHTAHHLDVKVPFYNLPGAQMEIEKLFPGQVVREKLTVATFLDICRICKLYDYSRHCWMDFLGNVTSETSLARRSPDHS